MLRRLGIAFASTLLVLGAAVTAEAATSATQNINFSIPATVSIASNGDVNAGALLTPTTVTGSFTIGSNDANGFSLTYSTPSTMVQESGCGSPSQTLDAGHITAQASAITGQGSGTGGTPAAANSLGTTPVAAYTVNPTAVGGALSMTASYHIDSVSIPTNTVGCSYKVPAVWTIAAS